MRLFEATVSYKFADIAVSTVVIHFIPAGYYQTSLIRTQNTTVS